MSQQQRLLRATRNVPRRVQRLSVPLGLVDVDHNVGDAGANRVLAHVMTQQALGEAPAASGIDQMRQDGAVGAAVGLPEEGGAVFPAQIMAVGVDGLDRAEDDGFPLWLDG
ncbi:hypothetical protein D3C71_1698910 [compost metagenome]